MAVKALNMEINKGYKKRKGNYNERFQIRKMGR